MTALLLAEPEPAMRGFLERQLSSDGFDVLAFSSPDELPRAAEPDVLVLGDPEALDRCLVRGCPVIVLGSADAETRVRALERCDDYLSRPFVYEELVGWVSVSRRQRVSEKWLVRAKLLAFSRKRYALQSVRMLAEEREKPGNLPIDRHAKRGSRPWVQIFDVRVAPGRAYGLPGGLERVSACLRLRCSIAATWMIE